MPSSGPSKTRQYLKSFGGGPQWYADAAREARAGKAPRSSGPSIQARVNSLNSRPISKKHYNQAERQFIKFMQGQGGDQGGPSGGYSDGGGYGDGGYAEQMAAYIAQIEQKYGMLNTALDTQAGAGNTQLDTISAQAQQRLKALQGEQTTADAATLAKMLADSKTAQANYSNTVDPVTADLKAQGFSSDPVTAQATLQQQSLADNQSRQSEMSARFAQIANRSFNDRAQGEVTQTAGAREHITKQLADYKLQLAMQKQAELFEAQSGGGSGGGGGGRGGRGGGGGSDGYGGPPSISVSNAASDVAGDQFFNVRDLFGQLGGTPYGDRILDKAAGRINPQGSNAGSVLKWLTQKAKSDKPRGYSLSSLRTNVLQPVRKAANRNLTTGRSARRKGKTVTGTQGWRR